jgi:hypothetical protein
MLPNVDVRQRPLARQKGNSRLVDSIASAEKRLQTTKAVSCG